MDPRVSLLTYRYEPSRVERFIATGSMILAIVLLVVCALAQLGKVAL